MYEDISEGSQSSCDVVVTANGTLTATYPAAIYRDPTTSKLMAIMGAVATTSRKGEWGAIITSCADGATTKVRIKGNATFASGGTAGNVATAIGATGAITDATLSAVTVLAGIGLSTGSATVYLP